MKLDLFDYSYPDELTAQAPAPERDQSRLMVVDPQAQSYCHQVFPDILSYFGSNDLIVFNDVKVFPSRLRGHSDSGRKIEVLLLDQQSANAWQCLVKPANKIKSGTAVIFSEHLSGLLVGVKDNWAIKFSVGAGCPRPDVTSPEFVDTPPLHDLIAAVGLPPLPPYIKRDDPFAAKDEDISRYQTVYAQNMGAAAAPTAGFHFTEAITQQLKQQGCELAYVTLHVGRDTFQPVRTENITEHPMHGEHYEIPEATAIAVQRAKQAGKRITAVGTTSLRTLESAYNPLQFGKGYTEKFIYPGYQFQLVDRLLTNFHQPKSTLIMLVSAFAGREFIMECYQAAIAEQYRLFSFGDAMLILNRIS